MSSTRAIQIGRIGTDGTVYYATWTCSHPQTGEYIVQHNLNWDPATYVVLTNSANDPGTLLEATAQPPPQTSLILHVAQQDWNSFTIKAVQGSSLTALDAVFNFAVIPPGVGAGAGGTGITGAVPPAGSIVLKDAILYRALRLAQVTRGPGRTANPEQFNDALIALNGMLDSLNIQHDAIYSIDNKRYRLTPSKKSYSIGIDPTGLQTADFHAPRPIRIDKARLVLTSSPTPVYLPLALATADQWATITVRDIPTTIPQVLFCDYDYPLANLFFWGYPTAGNDVELWTWQPFTFFGAITDSVVMPPGYVDMCVYNLAVRLADQFGTVLPPNVLTEARRTLGRIKALNSPSTPMGSNDYGTEGDRYRGGGRGDWNYLSGM